ncbi:MAG: DUF2141 domain-containing protein [Bacteroidota bacterium]
MKKVLLVSAFIIFCGGVFAQTPASPGTKDNPVIPAPVSIPDSTINIDNPHPAGTGDLRVFVKGIRSDNGNLRIALYNTKGTYMGDTPFRTAIIPVDASEEIATFKDIPYGSYAVAIIHDENSNGELDKNTLGVPKEGYGFSNDAMGQYGPPEWMQSSFTFQDKESLKLITLDYGVPKR